ncbi:hypothetical protein OG906_08535 [Streptomyces sp. NBC_01426]|nr:hypothetical protein [Streptomyces sp. NBC_01426]
MRIGARPQVQIGAGPQGDKHQAVVTGVGAEPSRRQARQVSQVR